MIRRFFGQLSLAAALAASAPAAAQIPVPRIVQRAGPAVVSLKTYDASGSELLMGSGFILRDGRIVTNAHVVEGAARAEVFDAEGRLMGTAGHAEALSSAVDLAVLPRLGSPRHTVPLARRAPRVGEEVVAIGSPEGLTNTVSNGIVSAYRDVEGHRMMQITAPLSEGSSGGPVLNRRGEVVGVSVAVFEAGQNLNFAVPLEDVRAIVGSPPGIVAFVPAGAGPAAGEAGGAGGLTRGQARTSAIRVGQGAIIGALDEGDAAFSGGGFFDLYSFSARRGQRLTITLRSDEFDPYVRLARVGGADELDWVGADDDGGLGNDSRLNVTTPADGEYWIAVTAFDQAPGAYELSLREAAPGADTAGARAELDDRWVPAGESGAFERFLDRTRIMPQGEDVYRVWTRSVYTQPHTDPFGDTYDNVLSMVDYDCAGRRWRAVQVIQYLRGEVVWTSDDTPAGWAAWVPDSVGETTGETACRMARGG
jgi:serine protease Do